MNFADNFKQEQKKKEYKGSGKKKKAFSSAEGGGRVNINVHMKKEECADTIKLTKQEICQSAVSTLSCIYFSFRASGKPIDFETRDFIDMTVSIVLEDIFTLDKCGETAQTLEDERLFFEEFKKTCGMEEIDLVEDEERFD